MIPRILLVNGSPCGRQGNSSRLLEHFAYHLRQRAVVDSLVLAESTDPEVWESHIRAANGFVFATGTYWDSWGSPLQRFLESLTPIEATDAWLGKPAAVLVTMHSVGGKAVLSRLQGVLNTLGLMIPPLCGWVYSATAQAAIEWAEPGLGCQASDTVAFRQQISEDVWSLSDLQIVAHNLIEATNGTHRWNAWTVERRHFDRRWIEPSMG